MEGHCINYYPKKNTIHIRGILNWRGTPGLDTKLLERSDMDNYHIDMRAVKGKNPFVEFRRMMLKKNILIPLDVIVEYKGDA